MSIFNDETSTLTKTLINTSNTPENMLNQKHHINLLLIDKNRDHDFNGYVLIYSHSFSNLIFHQDFLEILKQMFENFYKILKNVSLVLHTQ